MNDEPNPPDKKLHIDEDWKSQVEAERQAAQHVDKSATPAGDAAASARPPLPANLAFLIGTLYFQGFIALGLAPNPATRKIEVQLDQARHAIDMLAMLEEKTEGNRTPEESEDLNAALHELRMAFVTVQNK